MRYLVRTLLCPHAQWFCRVRLRNVALYVTLAVDRDFECAVNKLECFLILIGTISSHVC
jgi:hypothetical protein